MYLLVVLLPLLGAIAVGALGRFPGSRGSAMVTTSCVLVSLILSSLAAYDVALGARACYLRIGPWFMAEMFDASWGLLLDSPTGVMPAVVTCVSSLVHPYPISYMSGDPHSSRFMCELSIFTLSMLILVTADNFIQLFLGWEGVGPASYPLINFWHTRLQANRSALKAMLVNRVGDLGFALGILACPTASHSVDFSTICGCASLPAISFSVPYCSLTAPAITVMCILLLVGAVGKSAQMGPHSRLPDAMEGPSPVSALIHAATMVTAGVFMIARCSPLFAYSPHALIVITFVGAMTSFLAATTGMLQNDVKRVIAYSTRSQLGYTIFACGISHYEVGVFHLMNHAFLKALLFPTAGSMLHALSEEQDMRVLGGLAHTLPSTYAMMLMGSLSLIGSPYLTGFFPKDLILDPAYAKVRPGPGWGSPVVTAGGSMGSK